MFNRPVMSYTIYYNTFKEFYETAEMELEEDVERECTSEVIDRELIIKHNTMYEIFVYPITPISFYKMYTYDLQKGIDEINKQMAVDYPNVTYEEELKCQNTTNDNTNCTKD